MAVSLKDVARLAGVSIKTVSNVVNNSPAVSAATAARVRAALEALDYRPNISARGLRTGRTDLIALAIPALDEPYFAELSGLIVEAAARQGWTVLIEQTGGDRGLERQAAAGSRFHRIDGCIACPLALTGADVVELAGQRPLVLLGERFPRPAADHVAVDSVQAAREVTRHLIELGRRRIAFIGEQPATRIGGVRLAGYRSALVEAGHRLDEDLILPTGPFRRTEGAAAMTRLLAGRQLPDAVVCASDLLAVGALRTLLSAGVRVPEEVAVTGFDDIEEARYCTPSLTTVAPDKAGIAETAVELLCRRLRERSAGPPVDVVAGHRLQVRESTAGAAVTSGPPR
ncbi:LacI family DNA-binding transcriptional regulator [Jatrophihabitans sp.]|uniref:LacI family DNA-binding transcriptional regulator n=1 Tax=Jatrophihabitans sp. TaxID=1932789 RepID=UPI002BF4A2D3|nr:LacI family DNA-binding transcriptional regulator [Jatrophihabitans sp.]